MSSRGYRDSLGSGGGVLLPSELLPGSGWGPEHCRQPLPWLLTSGGHLLKDVCSVFSGVHPRSHFHLSVFPLGRSPPTATPGLFLKVPSISFCFQDSGVSQHLASFLTGPQFGAAPVSVLSPLSRPNLQALFLSS